MDGDFKINNQIDSYACLIFNSMFLIHLFYSKQVGRYENDTDILMRKLSVVSINAEKEELPVQEQEIVEIFSSIQGPWAFVFYQVHLFE